MKYGYGGMLFWLLLAGISVASLPASESKATPEDFIKWGEYDSLIRVLEPVIFESRGKREFTYLDSALKAKTFLYLGIAYYATGKHEHADDAFTRACELDSVLKIDRFYVNEEISAHFEGISAGLKRLRHQARIMALIPAVPMEPAESTDTQDQVDDEPQMLEPKHSKTWLWWTLGSATVIAGGISGYYLFVYSPSTIHEPSTEIK
jgi:tetratricopeptide (TPR) repeat protein